MARRKPKEEPEMLIVSFCDIVTITTAAMFFAMLITVQQAVKIPIYRPPPKAQITDKHPVFFECREAQVFFVDMVGLDEKVEQMLTTLTPNMRSGDPTGFIKAISGNEVGNEYYKVAPSYLLAMIMALEPRPGVRGDDKASMEEPGSAFQRRLRKLNAKGEYIVFLVRDDSFDAFRQARDLVEKEGFDTGWEMLEKNEPIKFGTGGSVVPTN